ncbi:unnamed protein product [Mycena citricolor]|uniref:Pectinesterase n=1 Tax=Mycena citricolor TaxID=2018698 RepID=A0AAD2H081_9AGAR|nr:unnamed protein product [Mycena citricolor]CAK5282589.1 unnamed protein product [Mycena citricolor]
MRLAISASSLFLVLFSAGSALGASRTSPPAGAVVVRAGTSASGEFATLSAAVKSLDSSSNVTIFMYPGTYAEQVDITRAGPLTIYGYTTDTSTYTANQVVLTAGQSLNSAGSDDASGTLRVHKNDFRMYNVNVKNTFGVGAQAIAISQYGTRVGMYACGFFGYQDTVYANQGNQVYLKSYIEGAVDFIFGRKASAYFGGNTIAVNGKGCITASGRQSDDANSYVFDHNTVVIASDAKSDPSGQIFFGRPWGNYAKVIFKNTVVNAGLQTALWSVWNPTAPNTDHILFADFNTTGSGAAHLSRANFSTALSASQAAQYDIASTVGKDYATWVDLAYFV